MAKKVKYDFSNAAPRQNTNAEKYVLRETLFGTTDVEPVWVADMDIDTPSFVLNAVKERLKHPIVGYEEVPHSAFDAQRAWMKIEHGFDFQRESMFYSHSVVASMRVAIQAFTKVGEGVIVQTPVYAPFFHSVHALGRKVVKNSLALDTEGHYSFDLEDLKKKINRDTKLLLLCSPHNPVGRVWKKEELESLLEICLEHNIIVFADEIHSDLVYLPNKHTPFATLKNASSLTLTAIGVGKTFNMAGFAMSSVVVEDETLRNKFQKAYDAVHFAQGSVFSHVAFESAYRCGEEWLVALKEHLLSNYKQLDTLCEKYPHLIQTTPIEATYLAWLDCRGFKLGDKALREFFIKEAKLGLNAGLSFGREGSGFMRLNFAVSSAKMSGIIQQLESALRKI